MTDLSYYFPSVTSVSIVPAGLTAHREGLYPLEPFSPEECAEVVKLVGVYGDMCLEKYGNRIFYASDEFYIKADLPLPGDEYYGEYEQLDNGVGLVTLFMTELDSELSFIDDYDFDRTSKRRVSVATGEAAYSYIKLAAEKIMSVCDNVECNVYCVKNEFFGGQVTVAGLLTGVDMAVQLKGFDLGDVLLIPKSSLRAEGDLFLCGHSPEWLSDELGVSVAVAGNDAASFVSAVLGCEMSSPSVEYSE